MKNVFGMRSGCALQAGPVKPRRPSGRLAARGVTVNRSAIARIESREKYVLDYELAAVTAAFGIPIKRLFSSLPRG